MRRGQKENQLPALHDQSQDVVPRRAEGVASKGNLKALAQYLSHLGQTLRPGAHEADIIAQNYLLPHLSKGIDI